MTQQLKGRKVEVAGCSLQVTGARTELNNKRNTLLRDAEKALKTSELTKNKEVKILFGNERQVLVNGEVAYQQNKWGVGGAFKGEFVMLRI